MSKLNSEQITDVAQLSSKEREQNEILANKMVKKGYRKKPEYYPVPPWVAEKVERKRYYLACLKNEIALRDGFK